MEQRCPHCGAALPADASFCPFCARDIRSRKTPHIPIPLRKKVLCALLALAALDAGGGVSSFTAGNVTIRRSGQAGQRQREAMALMGPYLTPSGFHFRGVRG